MICTRARMLIYTGYRHHEPLQEEIARIPNPYGLSRDVLVKKFLFDRDRAQRNSTARLKAQTEQGGGGGGTDPPVS